MNTKIYQYRHLPNNTEIGKGNTHETYMLVKSTIDLSNMLSPNVPILFKDQELGKNYELKSATGNEYRINQMGEVYRDYDVFPGDEIILTKIVKGSSIEFLLQVKKHNRIAFSISSNGAIISNLERMESFKKEDGSYSLSALYDNKSVDVNVKFSSSKPKRKDSPITTNFYDVTFDGKKSPINSFYLCLDEHNKICVIEKSQYNEVVLNDISLSSNRTADIVIKRTLKDSYTTEQLTEILKEMYAQNATMGVHMFGLKYGNFIKGRTKEIVEHSGINPIYYTEITKMIGLYNGIKDNLYHVCFYEDLSLMKVNSSKLPKVIKDMLSAFRTKPFLLLAGISGTGKSRIVKKMAFDTCTADDDHVLQQDPTSPGNYQLIEVKPNWHDSTEVLGYESEINGLHYVTTPFINFLVKAMCFPHTPFFVCMDEMNLAPVEQYFAEYLSVLESRKLINHEITSEPLIKADVFNKKYDPCHDIFIELGLDKVAKSVGTKENSKLGEDATTESFVRQDIVDELKKNGLRLPQNLIVVGTVNMDETTHQFSRKVIDRAMTIEMNIDEGTQPFTDFFANQEDLTYRKEPLKPLNKDLFLPRYVQASEALSVLKDEDRKYLTENVPLRLSELNEALNFTPFKIAYRVLNELVLYFTSLREEDENAATEVLFTTALDGILMMKVLPRIEGDEDLLEKPLNDLAAFTQNLTRSNAKIEEMKQRLNRVHFTSFWP